MRFTEEWLKEHIWPRFSRTLARPGVYLANHSLGRPLDQMEDDVSEFTQRWYEDMDQAWDAWQAEQRRFTGNVERLLGADVDTVTQRASAGQGLRAVLNSFSFSRPIRVVTTGCEFDSLDFILRSYVEAGLAEVTWVEPAVFSPVPLIDAESVLAAVVPETDLVIVSHVYFGTGQVFPHLNEFISACRSKGVLTLVDLYHSAGVLPLDLALLKADFAVGGSYKYLRGGPGASWLYVSPEIQSTQRKTLDTGWFAKADTFGYERGERTARKPGVGGWQESTPPVIATYQARSGLELALELGVSNLRAYSLEHQQTLRGLLSEAGVSVFEPEISEAFGAFSLVPSAEPKALISYLALQGVTADARGRMVRLCPDILNSTEDLVAAAAVFGKHGASEPTG